MRRGRIIFVLSMLLLVGTVSLWVASHGREMHWAWGMARARYTMRFADGWMAVWGLPPPASTALAARDAEKLVAGLNNDQLPWGIWLTVDDSDVVTLTGQPQFDADTGKLLARAPANVLDRPLLLALEDPDRIAAAHVALLLAGRPPGASRLAPHNGIGTRLISTDEGPARLDKKGRLAPHSLHLYSNGLRVELWPEGARANYASYPPRLQPLENQSGPAYRVDPDCFEEVRDQWHRCLDVRLARAPFWPVVVAVAVWPVTIVLRWLREARRVRRGCCPECGYDMHATPELCPECGSLFPCRVTKRAGAHMRV